MFYDAKTSRIEGVDFSIITNGKLNYLKNENEKYKQNRPYVRIKLSELFSTYQGVYGNNITPKIINNVIVDNKKHKSIHFDLYFPNENGKAKKIENLKELKKHFDRVDMNQKVRKKFEEILSFTEINDGRGNKKTSAQMSFSNFELTPPIALALQEFIKDTHQDNFTALLSKNNTNSKENTKDYIPSVANNIQKETKSLQRRFDFLMKKITSAYDEQKNKLNLDENKIATPDLLLIGKGENRKVVNGEEFQKEKNKEKYIVDFKLSTTENKNTAFANRFKNILSENTKIILVVNNQETKDYIVDGQNIGKIMSPKDFFEEFGYSPTQFQNSEINMLKIGYNRIEKLKEEGKEYNKSRNNPKMKINPETQIRETN